MRKQMMENAAYEVATQIRSVEESIEAALVELAELQTKMVHARSVTNAGFNNSHAAFEQLAATTRDLIAARGSIGGCHAALVETRKTHSGPSHGRVRRRRLPAVGARRSPSRRRLTPWR